MGHTLDSLSATGEIHRVARHPKLLGHAAGRERGAARRRGEALGAKRSGRTARGEALGANRSHVKPPSPLTASGSDICPQRCEKKLATSRPPADMGPTEAVGSPHRRLSLISVRHAPHTPPTRAEPLEPTALAFGIGEDCKHREHTCIFSHFWPMRRNVCPSTDASAEDTSQHQFRKDPEAQTLPPDRPT